MYSISVSMSNLKFSLVLCELDRFICKIGNNILSLFDSLVGNAEIHATYMIRTAVKFLSGPSAN